MTQKFDVVVIGAGPGGYVAAIKAAQLGLWSTQGPRPVPPWEWRRDCWKNKVCDGAGE